MRFMKYCFVLIAFFFSVNAFGGELKEIQLKDGSVLYGELISLQDDEFTIQSPSLGSVKVLDNKIHAIISIDITREETQALQKTMMNDKDILEIIISLQNDPDVVKVLEDKNLMKALNEGDMQTLISSTKFLKLLDNPKFQEILNLIMK